MEVSEEGSAQEVELGQEKDSVLEKASVLALVPEESVLVLALEAQGCHSRHCSDRR